MILGVQSIQQADYVVPVEIEFHWHNVYVIKRPGVDNFLKKMGEIYEVVVFTASLSKVILSLSNPSVFRSDGCSSSVCRSSTRQAGYSPSGDSPVIPRELLQS